MKRFVMATCLVASPWSNNPMPWYLVIERTTNVSSDWKIRCGTDDKAVAERELSRLNREETEGRPE